jgi:hypothetical protein
VVVDAVTCSCETLYNESAPCEIDELFGCVMASVPGGTPIIAGRERT